MRVLVTGANGFVGRHAVADLLRAGHRVVAMVGPGPVTGLDGIDAAVPADLLDPAALDALVAEHTPDACLHLAGIAFPPIGWKDPQLVFKVNVLGTIHLLEAFRARRPDARFLTISSSQVYGQKPRPAPICEDDPPDPENLYALSKWTADGTSLLYARRYGMPIMTARPCNHIGIGQAEDFVVTAFARQLIAIRNGKQEPVMHVGNLASEREFTDVRDTARAYRLLLEAGHPGLPYNVASANLTTIQALFDRLCAITGVTPTVEIDPARFRPTDSQPLLDCSRILAHTGWKPELPIETTLRDVVEDLANRTP
jgi:GDP-4-dehydro-6-deoxy-D-mannose reductase